MLQLLCLKILQDKNHFADMAFVGGTALRVLYDLRRFSEDLDFSVIEKRRYNFPDIIRGIERDFRLNGLEIETKIKTEKTVQNCLIKFPGLLKALEISRITGEKLSIRLEVDSDPPRGWQTESTLVNKIYVLNITHFDIPSLYATKLHACFFRRFTKGRDFYDLLWYLGKRIRPNYRLLNNAIRQTEKKDLGLNDGNISKFLIERLAKTDFAAVRKDVERFLEDKHELKLLESTVFLKAVTDVFGS